MKKYKIIIHGNDTYVTARMVDAIDFPHAVEVAINDVLEYLKESTQEQLSIISIEEQLAS